MYYVHEQFPLSSKSFNPLNTELNPICDRVALLGAHHILYVSRIRVNCYIVLQLEILEFTRDLGH